MRLNPLRIGVIAAAVSLGMWLVDVLWRPVFTVRLTEGFALPLWLLGAIYALLQILLWNATRKEITLSDEEIARWGTQLEHATPDIIRRCEAREPVKDIAAVIKREHGIPPDVTLRYIIALGQHVEQRGPG